MEPIYLTDGEVKLNQDLSANELLEAEKKIVGLLYNKFPGWIYISEKKCWLKKFFRKILINSEVYVQEYSEVIVHSNGMAEGYLSCDSSTPEEAIKKIEVALNSLGWPSTSDCIPS